MEPISLQCGNCGTRLRVRDNRALGKRIPCPICKAPVAVPGSTSTSAADSSLLAKALQTEGWPEPPELAAPPRRWPWQRGPTPPRRRRRHGHRYLVSVRLSPSAIAFLLLLLIGGVAAAILIPGTEGTHRKELKLAAQDAPADTAPEPTAPSSTEESEDGDEVETSAPSPDRRPLDLAYLPRDYSMLVALRVAELWDAPLTRTMLDAADPLVHKMLDDLVARTGISPADVKSVVVAFRGRPQRRSLPDGRVASARGSEQSSSRAGDDNEGKRFTGPHSGKRRRSLREGGLATSGNDDSVREEFVVGLQTPQVDPPPNLIVVRTHEPYDREGILAMLPERKSTRYKGKVYQVVEGQRGAIGVYFAADRVLVTGSEREVRAAVGRGGVSPPLPIELQAIDADRHVVIVASPNDEHLVPKKLGRHIAALALSVDVTDELQFELLLNCTSVESAEQLYASLNKGLSKAAGGSSDAWSLFPPALGLAIDEAMATASTYQHFSLVGVNAQIPAYALEPKPVLAAASGALVPLALSARSSFVKQDVGGLAGLSGSISPGTAEARRRNPAVGLVRGAAAPLFEKKGLDGEMIRLEDYAAKADYLLLDFWASW